MADEWETLREHQDGRIQALEERYTIELEEMKTTFQKQIDDAKQNEILSALKDVSIRLGKIESRLSEEDKVDSAKGIGR